MKRKQLRKSDVRKINEEIEERYGAEDVISKSDTVELIDDEVVSVNGNPILFYSEGILVPTLKYLLNDQILKKAVVDMGAVKFVTGGADIMRPGIVEIDEGISKGDFIAIVDQNNGKPLSVSQAMFDSDEIRSKDSGKVLKNVHHVGDRIWNI